MSFATDAFGRAFTFETSIPMKLDLNGLDNLKKILKTSLGPYGKDKLFSKKMILTNDGATILKNLTLDPISNLLKELSITFEKEKGDGTTSVVLLAIEMIRNKVNSVEKVIEFYDKIKITRNIDLILQSCINSKIIANNPEYIEIIKKEPENIFKEISTQNSEVIDYFILKREFVTRRTQNKDFSQWSKTTVVLLNAPLEVLKIKNKTNLLLNSANYLEFSDYQKGIYNEISNISDLIICQWGFEDECMVNGCRWVSGEDMEKLSIYLDTPIYNTMTDMKGVDVEFRYLNGELHLRGKSNVILRGSNKIYLDEVERSFEDMQRVYANFKNDEFCLPGGGECELLAIEYLRGLNSSECDALAETLSIIPSTLRENGEVSETYDGLKLKQQQLEMALQIARTISKIDDVIIVE